MNKTLLRSGMLTALLAITPALWAAPEVPEISIRHLSTAFVNHGICSVRFGIGSDMAGGDAGNVEIAVDFVNPAGEVVHQDVISTYLEDTTAGRYQEEFVESEDLCLPEDTRAIITRATVTIGDEVYDLIALDRIREDNFRPYQIQIGQMVDIHTSQSAPSDP